LVRVGSTGRSWARAAEGRLNGPTTYDPAVAQSHEVLLPPRPESVLREAVTRGEQLVEVRYDVPRRTKDDVAALDRSLRAFDGQCRSGRWLLTMATPPEAEQFREWVFGKISRQIDGWAPRSWVDWRSGR
jgi:hypothetical protein